MRLKKIKLAGFKSFVDPTSIPFPDDMTAIVGPNGCGKSNVIDAVRWVLGESSAKNLRGDAMIDVIFNGSSARKPVSQCSVELVFDNSSGRIEGEYGKYTELSVKRLVTREGQSNYFLNASKCRRRDVTDLFLGTGLGPRSYAIIEQGMISRLIESKPQELRVFIEEAAGISKYKERRRETENRIRHTRENLERLEDVRQELGQQLDKLQRQAAAAKRFKELKARERKLKGELAAVRWLKHNEHVAQLEHTLQEQETELEAFIAQQRGDERGMTGYKEQQADLKQALEDVQQQLFKIGTDITRLEQNQIHAKQRKGQITQELESLATAIEDAVIREEQQRQQLEELEAQLAVAEPEQMIVSEQLEQTIQAVEDAEHALQDHEKQWRNADQDYIQLKQQVQSCHSQLQATLNMQMRTQQRIGELEQEQQELEHDLLQEQMQSLSEEVELAKARFEEAREAFEAEELVLQEHQRQEDGLRETAQQAKAEWQRLDAQCNALQHVLAMEQQENGQASYFESSGQAASAIWQWLDVQSGWEKALETVLTQWQGVWVTDEINGLSTSEDTPPWRLWLTRDMQSDKPEGTLASVLNNAQVPEFTRHILLAHSDEQAMALRTQLQEHQSVLSRAGEWLGRDFWLSGSAEQHQGSVQRAAELKQLESARLEAELGQNAQAEQLAEASRLKEQAAEKLKRAREDFRQAEQALTQEQNQLNLLQMQHQQSQSRQSRIAEDLHKQREQLEQEKEQSEALAMQAEELEMVLAEKADTQSDLQEQRETLLLDVDNRRQQAEQARTRAHQLELQLQQVRNQKEALAASQSRDNEQLQNMRTRQHELQQEQYILAQPMEEQAEQLEVLLAQKLDAEQLRAETGEKLAQVDETIRDIEKGQQGVQDKIQKLRSAMESTRLECEGYRVRANGVLEQLREIQQSLKPILESLPEDANEEQWQQDLEKTLAAVSRLGAVNLAAVEEYETQSQRKQHLDEQNDDLTAALETLESAIRKIDKETRSRFKTTFDEVNGDLKSLFPKVFGGGAAYLELTDDDLLETGVTIMARPPGKKNSTIHLLSGGEKALTALSLVFAIFRLNPAPFCLLDEVDAPLDDANVGRFCKLVSEMSKSVQFIYITHNKIAMEMASHLTGVTMAEPGVSRMVAVDVDEAVAIAQA